MRLALRMRYSKCANIPDVKFELNISNFVDKDMVPGRNAIYLGAFAQIKRNVCAFDTNLLAGEGGDT
jgi:hypothetical protein